jgi:AcrR family transcriptional regulator
MVGNAAHVPLGLREREKRRTRQAIYEVGLRLFAEQGYANTTLAEVASAADVASSTFFNYFPTKPDLVLSFMDAIIESARKRLLTPHAGESATDALLAWVSGDLLRLEGPYSRMMPLARGVIESDPELRAAQRVRLSVLEDIFAALYARDLGESPDGVRPRVMATIALRGMSEVWESWYQQHASDADLDIRQAFELKALYLRPALAAGLEAVASLPPTHG